MFFPSLFDNIEEVQSRSFRKKRLLALCDMIIATDKNVAIKNLYEIEVSMLNLVRPKNFIGTDSYEIQFEKNYQTVCHGLNSHTNKDVKKMTVLEVYTLMEMLKKKEKENG
jgi:hypothetical protein